MDTIASTGLRRRRSRRRARAGSAYVWLVSMAMLLTVVGLAATAVERIRIRGLTLSADWDEAGRLASSAVEHALTVIAADPDWRSHYTSGVAVAPVAVGRGTFEWKLVDEYDDSLANGASDPARLYGIGRAGGAVRLFSVVLAPSGSQPLTCLEGPLTVGGNLTFQETTVQPGGQKVACNADVTAVSSAVNADVEAVGAITGLTYTGTKTSGVPAKGLPGRGVFEHYMDGGTWIPVESIPVSGSNRLIDGQLLSPAHNPFGGGVNPQGIYVIDCAGARLVIRQSRIVGTLVVLNAAADSNVQSGVNWAPAVSGYPCLLVRGNFGLGHDNAPFVEPANFNPPGTAYPYPTGESDSDVGDAYPSQVDGLVYVSGNVTSSSTLKCRCLVAGGAFLAQGTIILNYDSRYADAPPPGFQGGPVAALPGSWRWELLP